MSDWYFAYGSNLWIDQMERRTGPISGGAHSPRVARLPNYRLAFNMRGDEGDVFANIETPGLEVLGVLYYCSPEALEKLDAFEAGYERQRIQVMTETGEKIIAFVYIALPTYRTSEGRPSAEYLKRILKGAEEHGLPQTYLRQIEALALT